MRKNIKNKSSNIRGTNKKRKVAFITGITGQDGSYLAEYLLEKGYKVHGLVRRSSSFNRGRIEHLYDFEDRDNFVLHYGDITDIASITYILSSVRPSEIYNLAAQSHVRISYETPHYTSQVDALGTLNILEAVRSLGLKTKIYQASTSELYSGDPSECPQNEKTPFNPKSPYGVAKLYGFHICRIYRESYGLFVSNGILFNHESERRGENFVTRKITLGIANILSGRKQNIKLGNLNAKRDWGYAKNYVKAMHKMLQLDKPVDLVIATGKQHSVKEFCQTAFKEVGINLVWKGRGVKEIGMDKKNGKILVKINPKYFRPNEVQSLVGDMRKARKLLGWKPETTFAELVKKMVRYDIENSTTSAVKRDAK